MSCFRVTLVLVIVIKALYVAYPDDEYYESKQKIYFEAIRVPDAWKQLEGHERSPKTIAVIDTGMDSTHPDLKDNAVVGYNVVDKSTDTRDKDGHGTRMAGIVGAVINNKIGIAGITDHVKLMPIYDGDTEEDTYVAAAIEYAVKAHVDVILYTSVQEEPFEDAAVAALQSASKAGIPFICSSGNDGLDISKPGNQRYPCEYAKTIDGVICVAATVIKEMELLEISNYAPYINAAAPGYAFSTDLNGKYVARAGASCSAAMVAGVVTMMKSVSKEPLSVQAINSIIKETSTPGIERKGVQMDFGRLDALAAVKRVLG